MGLRWRCAFLRSPRFPGPTSFSEVVSIAPELPPFSKGNHTFICASLQVDNRFVAIKPQNARLLDKQGAFMPIARTAPLSATAAVPCHWGHKLRNCFKFASRQQPLPASLGGGHAASATRGASRSRSARSSPLRHPICGTPATPFASLRPPGSLQSADPATAALQTASPPS